MKYPSDVTGVRVFKPVNEPFIDFVDHHSYPVIKKSVPYENHVANERSKMTKIATIQMNNETFNNKDPFSTIFF